MEEFRFVFNSSNHTMIFLSCLNERGNTFICVTLPDENISCCFRAFHFLAGSSKIHSCQFNSIFFFFFFCIESSAIHRDRACCQKMTNCPKYAPKYAITLSISCLVIVFLNRGENGPAQFNFSGLFLIRPQSSFCVVF